MSQLPFDASELLNWYQNQARPLLEMHAPDEIASMDAQVERVKYLGSVANEKISVCFLGSSGVGKSTLLNALVSDRYDVLPHGGIGPLTAQATEVCYSKQPYFRVSYFPPKNLNMVLFTLERAHERLEKCSSIGATDELASPLDEEDRQDAEAILPDADATSMTPRGDTIEAYQRQARLLIRGDQQADLDLSYLVDGLRLILGGNPRWGSKLCDEDAKRIDRVRACISLAAQSGTHRERHEGSDTEGFLVELREHASGFLAPLIKSLEVGWDAEMLRDGLVLVDLPGVGVANDEFRKVTNARLRDARAVVLVVDRSGVTEASAEQLRNTGFFTRLLHDSHDAAADPVTLAVVMVKVDETARAAFMDERTLKGPAARKWNDHFREACTNSIEFLRANVRSELGKLVEDGPEATRAEREATITRVLQTLQVHPVSAPQYRFFLLQDEDLAPKVKSAEESRIPDLRASLRALAAAHYARCRERAVNAAVDAHERLRTALVLVQAQWERDTRAEKEAKQLREELETFLAPRQRELETRRGAFREFLRESIPAQIEARVAEAALIAKDDIARFLRKLEAMHWATLRATIRRGGAFVRPGKPPLDLPAELTLRFEEPIAVVWSKYILTALRTRTAELGKNYVALVGEVVEWARGQKARVQGRFVEALHESLVAQTKDLSSVGAEAVDDLKKRVHEQLGVRLEKKIRHRCHVFIDQKKDEGPGVKQRILTLCREELSSGVAEIAQGVAATVLGGNYQSVQLEIEKRFSTYRNPLDAARDSIVDSHEDGVRRSDAQRRPRVLGEIAAVLNRMPRSVA